MASDSIKISLEVADKAAQDALLKFINNANNADKAVKNVQDTGKTAFSNIANSIGISDRAFDSFVGNLTANIANKAFDMLSGAASAMFNTFVVDGIKGAIATEDAMNKVNVALAQSGKYTAETSKRFEDLASSIQDTTTYGDDAVLSATAMIQTMGKLSTDGLERATKAAVQLSAAFGIDLNTASEIVGKAATGNVTSLQKLGIQFEKSGDKAKQFDNVLTSLESFNGSAEAQVLTFSGALKNAENAFADITKVVGQAIIQNPVILQVFNDLKGILGDLKAQALEGKDGLQKFISEGFLQLISATKGVVQAFDVMVTGTRVLFNSLLASAAGLAAGLLLPFTFFSEEADKTYQEMLVNAESATSTIGDIFNKGSSLGGIPGLLDKIDISAQSALGKTIPEAGNKSLETMNALGVKTKELSDAQQKLNEETIKWAEGLARTTVDSKSSYDQRLADVEAFYAQSQAAETNALVVNYDAKLELETEYFNRRSAVLDQKLLDDQMRLDAAMVDKDVREQAETALLEKHRTDRLKLETDYEKRRAKIADDVTKAEKDRRKQEYNNVVSSLGAISSLTSSSSRELFEIGKAASLAQATMSGIEAVQRAWATPAPFNIALAALTAVATAANVTKIAQMQPPAFEQGGIVPGASFTGDRVTAHVNSGEMILNRSQQTSLFNQINSGRGDGDLANEIRMLRRDLLNQPLNVSVDGREIINVTRNQLASGRSFA